MTVLFNLDVSTHVTKSSICLEVGVGNTWYTDSTENSPRNKVSRIYDIIGSNTDMALFDKFDCLILG